MRLYVSFSLAFQYLYKENGKHRKQATKNLLPTGFLRVADPVADALTGNNRQHFYLCFCFRCCRSMRLIEPDYESQEYFGFDPITGVYRDDRTWNTHIAWADFWADNPFDFMCVLCYYYKDKMGYWGILCFFAEQPDVIVLHFTINSALRKRYVQEVF